MKSKEDKMKELQIAAGLFEVSTPEFRQLKACRKEIQMLKALWDQIILVRSSFEDWNYTLWSDINVENMEMDCKKFVKDIRTLDKEMRAWDAFSGLDSTVKNMVTSLRSVGELQNQAIRDRHWEQLMQATQVLSMGGGSRVEVGGAYRVGEHTILGGLRDRMSDTATRYYVCT